MNWKNAISTQIQTAQLSVKMLLAHVLKNGPENNKDTGTSLYRCVFLCMLFLLQVHCFARWFCLLENRVCSVWFRCSCVLLFSLGILISSLELFFLKFNARSGLCSLIYQILPRAKQMNLSVTVSRYIGLAPFSFRSITLVWFFFRSFFPVDSFECSHLGIFLYSSFPFRSSSCD